MSLRLATVLKSGPEFTPQHLFELVESALHFNPDLDVVCLTDVEFEHSNITTIPLIHGWQGWWSKLELFRPGLLDGPTIYLDIDTRVIGELRLRSDRFTMLRDVYQRNNYGSGVMGWHNPPTYLYEKFKGHAEHFMQHFRTRRCWGDQGFIQRHLKEKPDTFGREFRSYKKHCLNRIPEGTKVVYFHGKPRPWQVSLSVDQVAGSLCSG